MNPPVIAIQGADPGAETFLAAVTVGIIEFEGPAEDDFMSGLIERRDNLLAGPGWRNP